MREDKFTFMHIVIQTSSINRDKSTIENMPPKLCEFYTIIRLGFVKNKYCNEKWVK